MPDSYLRSLDSYRDLVLRSRSPEEIQQVKEIGHEIRELRKVIDCTREALAQRIGIELELLVLIENGEGNLNTALQLLAHFRAAMALR